MTKTTLKPSARSAKKSAERDARLAALTDQLSQGVRELADTDAWQRYLDFQAKFPRYSFANTMLIAMQCPQATLVMPYGKPGRKGTWMDIGRHARAGEKALYIRKPAFQKIAAEDSASGEEVTIRRFIWVPVFDISQTEGDPVPEHVVRLLDGEDPDSILALIVKFTGSHGYSTEFVPEIPGSEANGDCTYGMRRIRVCTAGRSPLQQVKTAIHEAAHMLLHEGSMAERGLKELEAESVAYVVAQALGLETEAYSFGYVLGWAGYDANRAQTLIRESGARIQEASRAILEGTGAIEARTYDNQKEAA